MIEIQGITFGYSPTAAIFEDFSWTVARNDSWAILGPSGCGKSTLLYLLAGLKFPSAGHILIDGQPVTRPRPQTGLILQDYGLLPWATVRENAALGLQVRKFYGPDGTHAPRENIPAGSVDAWLVQLGIQQIAEQYPSQISGGQRQRTAIARTLVLSPDLLLMDEPFSSVDAITRTELQELTIRLCLENGITRVVVTHSIEEAAILGRKILVLKDLPHQKADIIENPESGLEGYTRGSEYQRICQMLRGRMEAE